jgi:predicted ATPase
MIGQVHIQNFKSIKRASLELRRVNVFIGDTNTGKSNILEALTLFSQGAMDDELGSGLVRYGKLADLFHAKDQSEPVYVQIDGYAYRIELKGGHYLMPYLRRTSSGMEEMAHYTVQPTGKTAGFKGSLFNMKVLRYEYRSDVQFGANIAKHLEPPYGSNLPGLLASNRELRDRIGEILKERGVRIIVDNEENTISLPYAREEGVEVRLPYRSVSETLRRYIFIYVAMQTAPGDTTLLFDEPEQNTFPFYTKHIAEMMALDTTHQYVVTTHNEYLLRSLIEKTPENDLAVFVTHTGPDHETLVKRMTKEALGEMMDMDVFFNIDRFIGA